MTDTKTTPKTSKATKKSPKKDQKSLPMVDNTKLKLVIPSDKAQQSYQKALTKIGQSIKTEGFRKGKAPKKVVEERIGREKIVNYALEDIVPQLYVDLIKKQDKKPLTQPSIKVVSASDGQDWELEIQIAEKPEIKLGKYQDSVKKAHKKAVDEIKKQEKEIKEHIKAHKDNPDEHHGHAAPQEMTDQQKEETTLRVIFQELVDLVNPQIPELLIQEDVKKQLEQLSEQLKQFKMDFEEYLKRRGMSFEQLTSQMAINSLSSYQVEFILDEIIQSEKMSVEDKDLEEYLEKIKSNKKPKDLDAHTRSHFDYTILRRKVIDFLLALK